MSDDNCTCCPQHRVTADRMVAAIESLQASINRLAGEQIKVQVDGRALARIVHVETGRDKRR
jgi:hypothetical protein